MASYIVGSGDRDDGFILPYRPLVGTFADPVHSVARFCGISQSFDLYNKFCIIFPHFYPCTGGVIIQIRKNI